MKVYGSVMKLPFVWPVIEFQYSFQPKSRVWIVWQIKNTLFRYLVICAVKLKIPCKLLEFQIIQAPPVRRFVSHSISQI